MRNVCGEPGSGKMSCHGKDLMEHVAYVSPLALHGISMDGTGAHYKDALRIGLPFHLDAAHPDQRLPYRRLSYFPFHGHLGVCDYTFEPAFIRKRNERERHRVRCVNEGYARLREHLPPELEDKRLSKVETLRAAIDYIKHLQSLLELNGPGVEMSLGEAQERSHLPQRRECITGETKTRHSGCGDGVYENITDFLQPADCSSNCIKMPV
ncbi:achaete-scute homolog 3-like [Genypterus blacodes]|uniref:achaete-scute homolog 3-like n=1 Tax=Genypterus blacodes TaxID=154954 RepID=UPI003F76D777